MQILLLNTTERTGGAAIACNRLMKALINNEVDAKMLVLKKESDDEHVVSVQSSLFKKLYAQYCFLWERLIIFVLNKFSHKNLFKVSIANVGFDVSKHPLVKEADVIHLHWINQGFLSLKNIEKLIQLGKPIVWTMHDMWTSTGICHYPGNCDKYQNECYNCPLLATDISKDLSQKISAQKKRLNLGSISYVGCSHWISKQVKNSSLLKNATVLSIPNPIDTKIFYPKDKITVRKQLQLPLDKQLLLFTAAKISDSRKGGVYFVDACNYICKKCPALTDKIEIVLMGKGDEEFFSGIKIKTNSLQYIANDSELADVYSAVDVFVIPSLEDNLPNTIMESMACGTPCVGFNTGGIPEMIDHRKNGYIATYKSSEDLAEGIVWTITNNHSLSLSGQAVKKVKDNFTNTIIGKRYSDLYYNTLNKI